MIYSSLLFIYMFLPLSLLIYYITPKKQRDLSLLILSGVFCASFGLMYLAFMAVYVIVNYTVCRLIEAVKKKKLIAAMLMITASVFDLAVIFVFRLGRLSDVLTLLHIPKGFFPIGISFFTLSALGTIADVYFDRIKAEKSIISFALYFMFFPRLIMGPVLRYSSFRKMLGSRNESLSEMGVGFMIFIIGLAKKVMIADSMGRLVEAAMSGDISDTSALTAWLGITGYVLCLYFTISGISDMGTGIGYLFGFRFPQSFNYPLFSSRLMHFAARWHMQVVLWFRRYLTRPLVSLGKAKLYRKLVYVFVWALLGYWYRFSINGIIWGIILSTAVLLEKRFVKDRTFSLAGMFATFIMTVISTAFFMGGSVRYSLKYLIAMFGGNKLFADQLSLYLLKSYAIILIIAIYASTSMFRSLMIRSGKTKVQMAVNLLSPLILLAMITICTVMISYNGSSDAIMIRL